ncbi:manganese catalase family protein [Ruthenibacterium lactatiformans]|uniref:manganese catalase family protein n=1 Tax=Ruthenibacterium lactatiformans TaxID=1550024 RepID=UPI00399FC9B0
MWSYEKRLQFPVRIKTPNAAAAKVIITQYGGPDGELGASMRYLSQRYTMPWRGVAGLLTDIGTEGWPIWNGERHCIPADKGLSADEIRRQASTPIVWTIRPACGPRRRAVRRSRPCASPARATPSRICTRTWQQMARPEKNNNVASPVLCVFPVHLPEQRKYKKTAAHPPGMHGCFAKENEPRDSFYFLIP